VTPNIFVMYLLFMINLYTTPDVTGEPLTNSDISYIKVMGHMPRVRVPRVT
jgi:hypothetical protein